MKQMSLYVSEKSYEELKSLSRRAGRPVAELIREAMAEYVERRRRAHSILDIPAHDSGRLLESWTRAELWDEMLER